MKVLNDCQLSNVQCIQCDNERRCNQAVPCPIPHILHPHPHILRISTPITPQSPVSTLGGWLCMHPEPAWQRPSSSDPTSSRWWRSGPWPEPQGLTSILRGAGMNASPVASLCTNTGVAFLGRGLSFTPFLRWNMCSACFLRACAAHVLLDDSRIFSAYLVPVLNVCPKSVSGCLAAR